MKDLLVSAWPIDKVIPFARNARKIPASAVAKVAASIKEFGWRQPIVIDREGVIICGHTRLLAARKLGLDQQAACSAAAAYRDMLPDRCLLVGNSPLMSAVKSASE